MNVHVKKTVPIEFKMVVDAYQKVRTGGKAAGIDGESWEQFDKKRLDNLYIIWNRLASGSYHPMAVREAEIPKEDGKMRKLGISTLRDRIAQCVVKEYVEKRIDHLFSDDSYGYRPLKSSKEAIEAVKSNCIEYDWVLDLDISNFFDEIDHELLMKGVERMIGKSWVSMYVERWLKMKVLSKEGKEQERQGKGTPQGGVISPLLSNIFLHYALDKWLEINYPELRFVRYADDVVIHARTKQEAEEVLTAIRQRLKEVKLRLNEQKTKIVYCKDYRRTEQQEKVQFDFLGFSYQPRKLKSKYGNQSFTGYTAEISKGNQRRIRETIRKTIKWNDTTMEIGDIAQQLNSKLRGWINYFGLGGKRSLKQTLTYLDWKLLKWIKEKYKIQGMRKAIEKLSVIKQSHPQMFWHWRMKYCYLIKK